MRKLFVLTFVLALFSSMAFAQAESTSTDVFVMGGSDFVRPGLLPRVNLNIGIGHTEKWLKKNPFGDELTFSYTYENGGSHGFFHTKYGSHTENIGVMKNFALPKTKKVTGYTWPLIGVTSMTGNKTVLNRLYLGAAVGASIHFSKRNSVWLQETWNKVVTVAGYPTTSVGYTFSF